VTALTRSVMTVEYLNPEHFPNQCTSPCGCRDGSLLQLGGDGKCDKVRAAHRTAHSGTAVGRRIGSQLELGLVYLANRPADAKLAFESFHYAVQQYSSTALLLSH
jgi:hypothetical protein